MRTWNFGKRSRTAVLFRVCLVTIITLSLAMGGIALHPKHVRAIGITAAPAAAINVPECEPFEIQFTATGTVCAPPPEPFFWTWGALPAWVNFDWQTGLLTGCAPIGASTDPANPFGFFVGVTEYNLTCDPPCPCHNAVWVTINVTGPVTPGTLIINPTLYQMAWEGLPFSMTLSATGCSGTYTWSATGLPAWLTLDPATGVITGTPGLGTCNTVDNVTVTCTDAAACDPACCPPVSRSFLLFVDCWANYLPIFYYTTACDFTVGIGTGLTQGQTKVLIDGSQKATLAGGQSETFTSIPCQSHTVMVDQTIQVSNTKFSVIGSNLKTVTDTDNYAYFDYAPEVYIGTASDPSGATPPPGAGYYAVGSYFSSMAAGTVETNIQNGIKYVFREWGLPDGSTFPSSNLGFTVNQGGTATARYDTYYQLTLHSDYPAINETSWEKANSTATWNLALHAVPMESGFWAFLGGTISPVNASSSQLMTGPSTVEILWRSNYTGPIVAIIIILLVIAGIIFLVRWLRGRPPTQPTTRTSIKKAPPRAKRTTIRKRRSK
jgi:hypothetical protein